MIPSLTRLRALGLATVLWALPAVPAGAAQDAPVSPNALPEVASLLQFMDSIRGQYILSGQFELPAWNGTNSTEMADQETEMNYIFAQTGKYPAIRGFDFMRHSQDAFSQGTQRDAERAIQWHQRGGIVTYCFHLAMPAVTGGREFYVQSANSRYTNFDMTEAVVEGTAEYTELITQIDNAARELKKLNDARVPVLWRPFHECSGGWFWWGRNPSAAATQEAFKKIWILMFKRYTEVHQLTNLIWVFNPTEGNSTAGLNANLANWYPGDQYVDMISADYYATETNRTFAWVYNGLYNFTNGRKGVWMSENGPIPDPDLIFTAGANWTAFVTWYRGFITDGVTNSNAYLKKVYGHAKVITLDELPALWSTQPVFLVQPAAGEAKTGAKVVLSAEVQASGPLSFQWQKDGADLAGATAKRLVLTNVATANAGTYRLKVTNGAGSVVYSNNAELTVSSTPASSSGAYLYNISARAKVGTGENVLVAGFAIRGTGSKRVLVRAVGPSLGAAPFNYPGTLTDPYLTIFDTSGANAVAVAWNQDWWLDNKAVLAAAFGPAGAFALGDSAYDSALVADLPPGNYTAVGKGHLFKTGVAIVELYDLDPTSSASIVNLSTRAVIGTGTEQLAAGFSVQGTGTLGVMVRAIGPTLGLFGVPGVIADPIMTFNKVNGSNPATVLATNDNWADAPNRAAIEAVPTGFRPAADAKDAIVLQTVSAGEYTAEINGRDGGTGACLVEVYLAP